jgi:antitoxin component of MazEF toxin-antitoxin module
MTVTIKKVGGSLAVFIPRSMARDTKLTEGALMDISSDVDSIVIRRKSGRTRRPIAKVVSQIKTANYSKRRVEMLNDGPVGKEIR